jgi:hypothetical protein
VIIRQKYAPESRTYTWDFSARKEAQQGDRIATLNSLTCTPAGLTLGAQNVYATYVSCVLSGGTSGTSYNLTAVVTTQGGAVLDCPSVLIVL